TNWDEQLPLSAGTKNGKTTGSGLLNLPYLTDRSRGRRHSGYRLPFSFVRKEAASGHRPTKYLFPTGSV
ncbi:MAG: hypothetical protein K2L06_07015, partial [Alistipes sp.]|nr:hypothetical protein [Alistipes sp.]